VVFHDHAIADTQGAARNGFSGAARETPPQSYFVYTYGHPL